MRVTPTIENRNFLESLTQSKTRLDKAQNELSTGRRVNLLSDDPYAAAQSSEIAAVSSENDEFIANNDLLHGKLEFLDNTLQSLIRNLDVLGRLRRRLSLAPRLPSRELPSRKACKG